MKTKVWFAMCAKKKRYSSEGLANKVAKRIVTTETITSYYCPICFGYHLTHKGKKGGEVR